MGSLPRNVLPINIYIRRIKDLNYKLRQHNKGSNSSSLPNLCTLSRVVFLIRCLLGLSPAIPTDPRYACIIIYKRCRQQTQVKTKNRCKAIIKHSISVFTWLMPFDSRPSPSTNSPKVKLCFPSLAGSHFNANLIIADLLRNFTTRRRQCW